jgi:putative tryptophan/tyrosine transport system substrate-binding protein
MQRRKFITLLCGVAAWWPLAGSAQQTLPVIGFLNGSSPGGFAPYVAAFRNGLRESGYIEGQNVAIEYRWAEGRYDALPAMAADLIGRQVSVIVANTPAHLAAKTLTSTIPIVFTTGSDPVQIGLVSNLRRPGGNVTGVSQLNAQLGPKRLELAHELMPAATVMAFLVNPSDPPTVERLTRDLQGAGINLGLRLHILPASSDTEIEAAFASIPRLKADVLVIGSDASYSAKSQWLADLSLRYAVPAIYQNDEFANAGGLMSYGGSVTDSYHLAGIYTGRILKGEKPADLPVQQSTKVQLIVNLKTAKALGITVPLSLLGRADRVIE